MYTSWRLRVALLSLVYNAAGVLLVLKVVHHNISRRWHHYLEAPFYWQRFHSFNWYLVMITKTLLLSKLLCYKVIYCLQSWAVYWKEPNQLFGPALAAYIDPFACTHLISSKNCPSFSAHVTGSYRPLFLVPSLESRSKKSFSVGPLSHSCYRPYLPRRKFVATFDYFRMLAGVKVWVKVGENAKTLVKSWKINNKNYFCMLFSVSSCVFELNIQIWGFPQWQ